MVKISYNFIREKLMDKIIGKISENKIRRIVELINKYDPKTKEKDINVLQTNGFYFYLYSKNKMIKVFFNSKHLFSDYGPINKLNIKRFSNIVKLFYIDEDYYIIVFERLYPIVENNLLISKYSTHRSIKYILLIIMQSIVNLFTHNQQVNKYLSYENIGINKDGVIKIFNLDESTYIDTDNKYLAREEIYSSFKIFIDNFKNLLKKSEMTGQIYLIDSLMKEFNNKLTDIKIIEKPNIDGKYVKIKFRLFKFLEFETILNFIKSW